MRMRKKKYGKSSLLFEKSVILKVSEQSGFTF